MPDEQGLDYHAVLIGANQTLPEEHHLRGESEDYEFAVPSFFCSSYNKRECLLEFQRHPHGIYCDGLGELLSSGVTIHGSHGTIPLRRRAQGRQGECATDRGQVQRGSRTFLVCTSIAQ